ncbi:M15 family metallopeptidase [Butyrivibrio sp. YAB3001]|uniref:M15 family metallopeptidase n=1 Tax=Butyrivibrio sp. YAB3001 TaxID=1520812 RepID=UPI000B87C586|nr:M15 family metallopeptidase [Butyrivibrio sp. YAB3001]
MNKYIKDIILLFGIIIVCGFVARFMARGETLAEYDAKNHKEKVISEADSSTTANSSCVESSTETGSDTVVSNDSSDTLTTSSQASIGTNNSITNNENSNTNLASNNSSSISSEEKTIYSDGFYYSPLTEQIIARITGVSYKENNNISLDELSYCSLLYNDFYGETQTGELICNSSIAQDVIEIFYELYEGGYQIESIKLIDEFNADDELSMEANNTSCFNYREVAGTKKLSKHAYGLAIDINPFYNPYITYKKDGTHNIAPAGSDAYADRTSSFPYKIDENDLAYKLFKAHGFKWGGDWNSSKDYQHFER